MIMFINRIRMTVYLISNIINIWQEAVKPTKKKILNTKIKISKARSK